LALRANGNGAAVCAAPTDTGAQEGADEKAVAVVEEAEEEEDEEEEVEVECVLDRTVAVNGTEEATPEIAFAEAFAFNDKVENDRAEESASAALIRASRSLW
jgi:hypothetical protein